MQDPNKEYEFTWHSYKNIHLSDDAFVLSVPNLLQTSMDQGLLNKTTFAGDCLVHLR